MVFMHGGVEEIYTKYAPSHADREGRRYHHQGYIAKTNPHTAYQLNPLIVWHHVVANPIPRKLWGDQRQS